MPFDFKKMKINNVWNVKGQRYIQDRKVWATCPECGQGRWVREHWAKHEAKNDGVCRACVIAHPDKYNPLYKGHWRVSGGYLFRHRKSFSEEQQRLLEPMFKFGYRGNYILEHRAVMSLHLGRPLISSEIVHHLNGVRNDNRLQNLRLFTRKSEHPLGHGSFYQEWQEALVEIERLKGLIYEAMPA